MPQQVVDILNHNVEHTARGWPRLVATIVYVPEPGLRRLSSVRVALCQDGPFGIPPDFNLHRVPVAT
eukprot:8389717-Lingulodinium_polyedra.AAC.1